MIEIKVAAMVGVYDRRLDSCDHGFKGLHHRQKTGAVQPLVREVEKPWYICTEYLARFFGRCMAGCKRPIAATRHSIGKEHDLHGVAVVGVPRYRSATAERLIIGVRSDNQHPFRHGSIFLNVAVARSAPSSNSALLNSIRVFSISMNDLGYSGASSIRM